ncbi:MAG: Flp pilus assembly complex ATPase component TadA [Planctomycetes bacterium]|nr:Flp pilus assembly complex ATPase component TadA [Planctomycetota bacterium]
MTDHVESSTTTGFRFNGELLSSLSVSDTGEEGWARKRCAALGIDWLDEAPAASPEAVKLISAEVAVRLRVVPLRIEHDRLLVAMFDPLDISSVDEVSTLTGYPVTRVGVEHKSFAELMRAHYGTTAARMAESLASENPEGVGVETEHNLDTIEADDIHRMAEQPTLINLVNLLLLEAIQSRSSDVHIEPFENELKVKFRIDGMLVEQPPPPKHLQPALIGRVKIMAGMNIAERYVPQDGHITLRFEGRKVDLRVSTVPTLYGESVVMRILDKTALRLDFESLGMRESLRQAMDKLIAKPHGLVLVTGPTGSGKTTTLYAALTRLYDPGKKIITIEDPVEYELSGINQIPVNPKRGLTFATGLRHILRQDPDIVFVGEIRDAETAEIAIRSALTGHLIFSTLHTNDAISSISRLIDMGAEPYLVASVLEGALAQRLGRRVCPHCAEQIPMPEDISHRLSASELALFDGQVWRGAGCSKCNGSGYFGRVGFFEFVKINAALRKAISENRPTAELLALVNEPSRTTHTSGETPATMGGDDKSCVTIRADEPATAAERLKGLVSRVSQSLSAWVRPSSPRDRTEEPPSSPRPARAPLTPQIRAQSAAREAVAGQPPNVDSPSAPTKTMAEDRPTLGPQSAVDESYMTMRMDGLEKAAAGQTTIEEVLRATQDTEDSVV